MARWGGCYGARRARKAAAGAAAARRTRVQPRGNGCRGAWSTSQQTQKKTKKTQCKPRHEGDEKNTRRNKRRQDGERASRHRTATSQSTVDASALKHRTRLLQYMHGACLLKGARRGHTPTRVPVRWVCCGATALLAHPSLTSAKPTLPCSCGSRRDSLRHSASDGRTSPRPAPVAARATRRRGPRRLHRRARTRIGSAGCQRAFREGDPGPHSRRACLATAPVPRGSGGWWDPRRAGSWPVGATRNGSLWVIGRQVAAVGPDPASSISRAWKMGPRKAVDQSWGTKSRGACWDVGFKLHRVRGRIT